MIQVVSSLIQSLTLNVGDKALDDLSPGVKLGYFAVVCEGPELQLLDNSKAKAVRALVKARNYYQNNGVVPVAVLWTHNQHMLSTLSNLGYLCVCANAESLTDEVKAQYTKTALSTDVDTFSFKVCYWLRLPTNLTDDLDDLESTTRDLIDMLATKGSSIIELDAGVIKVTEHIPQVDDPADVVKQAVPEYNNPTDDSKYADFKTPDTTHSISPTLPLVVPEGILDIHEKTQHVIGLGT